MREVLSSAWEAAIERERAARRIADETAGSANGVQGKGKARATDADGSGGDPGGGGNVDSLERSVSRMSLAALSEVDASTASWEEDRERERAQEKEREAVERKKWQLALDSAEVLQLNLPLLGVRDPQAKVSVPFFVQGPWSLFKLTFANGNYSPDGILRG